MTKPDPGFYSFPFRTGCWEFDGKGHVREVEPEPVDLVVDAFLAKWDAEGVTITIRPPGEKRP